LPVRQWSQPESPCEEDVSCTSKIFRTYLRLPWRPLVSINGVTIYELNEDFQV
ncbi:hypothetical protein LINPERHAP1_LOCUS37880, partial [Linum perenne]